MVSIETTGCCALSHLRFDSNMTAASLKNVLDQHQVMVNLKWGGGAGSEIGLGGAPTLMAVVTPFEREQGPIVDCLRDAGFEWMADIPRRNGYPSGMLEVYFKTFKVQK